MSQLSTGSTAFLDRLRARLDGPAPPAPAAPAPQPDAPAAPHPLVVAAAVQHVFTLADLPGPPDAAALRQLIRDSVPAPGLLDRQGRILSRARRREVLLALGARGARAALDGRDPISTPTQRMFEALLAGRPPDIDALTRDELLALQEARGWLDGLLPLPFDDASIARALDRCEVWAPLAPLLGEAFVGRDEDLAKLAGFAGLAPDGSGGARPRTASPQRIALIEGVGGIGKTALIAQFLARLVGRDQTMPRLPFAYLACDDPAVDLTEAETLHHLAAGQILRQVRLAGPDGPSLGKVEAAHDALAQMLHRQSATIEEATRRSSTAGSLDTRLGTIRAVAEDVATGFARLADLASDAMEVTAGGQTWRPPCLIVIDTFEEVQYRSETRLYPFWRLIGQLLVASRDLRVVIAGRPPLEQPDLPVPVLRLALRELSHEAAMDLLARDSGVTGASDAPAIDQRGLDRLARQIGGNPLNLRLAARVIADEAPGRRGIEGLSTRRWGILRLGDELIRGQLYRRVLDHIHDPRVRALAHPGMILRRITPRVIAEVLADLCKIDLRAADDAEKLFDALAREHTLVRQADDRSLRYRDDVRRPVLKLLASDQPDLTRRAHRAAHDFYAGRTDPVSVAEAIYHGLMLGLDPESLNPLWRPEAGEFLAGAVEELPLEGMVWLAGKMDLRLPDAAYRAASTAEWERIAGPRALAMLQEAGSAEVLSMLAERRERTEDSPLIAIEARCLISLGDHGAAEALLNRALAEAPLPGNPGRRAELLWLLARSQWETGKGLAAQATLEDLAAQAEALPPGIALVQALTASIALRPVAAPDAPDLRARLARALARLTEADMAREPDVIRRGFARLDADAAAALARVALACLSGLYDLPHRDPAFGKPSPHVQAIREMAANISGRPEMDGLGPRMATALSADPPGPAALAEAFQTLRRPLARALDGAPDAAAAIAARMVWHLVQIESATLATATLAGIDAYRADWEIETAYRAATA